MLKERLNGNQLKLIAVLSMILDHVGYLLVGLGIIGGLPKGSPQLDTWIAVYNGLRAIGRMAFPIFCFLLTEGFAHTGDRKRYAFRLGLFALISEVPFDLMLLQSPVDWRAQNVFVTLFLGLLMMMALEELERRLDAQAAPVAQLLVIAGFCVLAWAAKSDYSYWGIMLIALFYWFRQERTRQLLFGYLWLQFVETGLASKIGLAVGFLTIFLYNGRRGRRKIQAFFYWFYPVHLLILYGIYRLMIR